jgi:NusA N-terminal domain.
MFYMNAEFIAMLDYLERERGIKREILLEAVSNALLSASKKSVGASAICASTSTAKPAKSARSQIWLSLIR